MRRASRAGFALSALLFAACDSIFAVELPRDRDYASYLLAFESADTLEVHVADRETSNVEFTARTDARFELLLFEHPLAELGLTAGLLVSEPRAPIPRAVPTPDAHYFGTRDGARIAWSPGGTDFGAALRDFRFRGIAIPDCVDRGGCLFATDITGAPTCALTCPDPALPDPPKDPDPVKPPILPAQPMLAAFPPYAGPCPEGQAQFFGEPSCALLGTPCPAGDFSESPAPGIIFVRPSTITAGRDGTANNPYATIADAIAAARQTSASTIALARGEYPEDVTLDLPLTVRGACVRDTHLTGELELDAAGAELENTTASRVIIRGRARIEDVDASFAVGQRATLRGRNLVARSIGREAFTAAGGSDVDVTRMSAFGGTTHSVRVSGDVDLPSRVHFADLIVDGAGRATEGLSVQPPNEAHLERVLVTRAVFLGFLIHALTGMPIRATVEDLFIRDIGGPDRAIGARVYDAKVDFSRVSIDTIGGTGLQLFNSGVDATVTDLHIARSRERAFQLSFGAVRISRALLEDSGGLDFHAVTATITDLTVRRRTGIDAERDTVSLFQPRGIRIERAFWEVGTRPSVVASPFGRVTFVDLIMNRELPIIGSMFGALGAEIRVERVKLDGCDADCFYANNEGSFTIEDLEVGTVRTSTIFTTNHAFNLERSNLDATRVKLHQNGTALLHAVDSKITLRDIDLDRSFIFTRTATVEIERANITRGTLNGIVVEHTNFTLRDATISEAAPESVLVKLHSNAHFERVRILTSDGYGIRAQEWGSITGNDIEVGSVLNGLEAIDRSSISFERVFLHDVVHNAIDVDDISEISVRAGIIDSNGIGAYLPTLEDRWLRPITDRVVYRRNGSNFVPR